MTESEIKPEKVASDDTLTTKKQNRRYNFQRRNRRGGRGQGQRQSRPQQQTGTNKEKFTGRCEDLTDFIFDATNNKGGLGYVTTSEEIARLNLLTYKMLNDKTTDSERNEIDKLYESLESELEDSICKLFCPLH